MRHSFSSIEFQRTDSPKFQMEKVVCDTMQSET